MVSSEKAAQGFFGEGFDLTVHGTAIEGVELR